MKRFDWTMIIILGLLAIGVALAALLPASVFNGPPQIFYLSPTRGPELWQASLDGRQPMQLTDTGGKVFDFIVTPNGNSVIYSVYNEQGGIDLWQIDLGNRKNRQLFPCGADWCFNPAVSPDGKRLAFSRRRANIVTVGSPGVPRVWLMDRRTGTMQELYNNPQVTGFAPSWSPDGSRLAFFDGVAGGIRIFDLKSGKELLIPSNIGVVGAWSPDGSEMLIVDAPPGQGQPAAQIYRANLEDGEVQQAFAQDIEGVDYGPPEWSTQGWLAVSIQLLEGGSSRSIWIMLPDGSQARQISPQEDKHYGAYRWSPDGKFLAFQQITLSGAESMPEVAVWNMQSGEVQVIAQDASRPQWGR